MTQPKSREGGKGGGNHVFKSKLRLEKGLAPYSKAQF
jgi:hypothetical protein